MTEKTTTTVTVCETCKRKDWDSSESPLTDGEKLISFVKECGAGVNNVQIRTYSCLMGCDYACNVSIQSHGKIAYAVGTFEPTREAAEAIVSFAALHAESPTGQVPYRTWPQAIKGHFRSRLLPLPPSDTEQP